jgi:hypothetical protein
LPRSHRLDGDSTIEDQRLHSRSPRRLSEVLAEEPQASTVSEGTNGVRGSEPDSPRGSRVHRHRTRNAVKRPRAEQRESDRHYSEGCYIKVACD